MNREVGLVRAELVDALRDHAEIFREKAALELRRAEATDLMAEKIGAGGCADEAETAAAKAREREQQILGMRFEESRMRCNRLIFEHGDN